jgi:hypothetical protein
VQKKSKTNSKTQKQTKATQALSAGDHTRYKWHLSTKLRVQGHILASNNCRSC